MANLLLFEPISCTYTYIIGCRATNNAVIIDPVLETYKRDAQLLHELGLEPLFVLDTHVHADHYTGAGRLKTVFPKLKSVISKNSGAEANVYVDDGEVVKFGQGEIEVRLTPGHTNGCATFVAHKLRKAFTGDALLFRGCGRTDFQEGNSRLLYESVHGKILSLPDDYALHPGHDYKGHLHTTVGEEKKYNLRLTKKLEDFVVLMDNLNLAPPKMIGNAVPVNKAGGSLEVLSEIDKSRANN
ncbi:unnamed protein product [Enterobius vermicularis]|uniref:Persulfide dioxygenase ETHE1, mitochondrial n=1 Tax=Enterobius vermicularis TaxID=51028 RepID=A0A0N4V1T7_ENTVE|nr:unnamed protein product [Enterobius vermicularis]